MTKRTYAVPFHIDGEVRVEAASPEEATRAVDLLTNADLAEIWGEREQFAPVLVTLHETETVQ
jgi:hypothetical protein